MVNFGAGMGEQALASLSRPKIMKTLINLPILPASLTEQFEQGLL